MHKGRKYNQVIHQIIYGEPDFAATYIILFFYDGNTLVEVKHIPLAKNFLNYEELNKFRFQSFSSN